MKDTAAELLGSACARLNTSYGSNRSRDRGYRMNKRSSSGRCLASLAKGVGHYVAGVRSGRGAGNVSE